MIEGLKPYYERLLSPAVSLLGRLGVRPNDLTVTGVVFFAAAGWCSSMGRWYLGAVLVAMGALLDGCDGLLARVSGKKSDFGAILDSTCDRLTEIIWIGGLFAYYLKRDSTVETPLFLCLGALTGSLMVSYVKARCEGQDLECRSGLLQRPERIIVLEVGMLLGPEIMVYCLAGVAALSWITVGQRLAVAYTNARGKA